jgi:NitT/TauT family transport system permease protein
MVGSVGAGVEALEGVVHGMEDPAARRRRRVQRTIYVARVALLVVVLGVWQYFGSRLGEITVSSPAHVYNALYRLAVTGTLWRDLGTTLQEVLFGYVIGSGIGILLGAVVASSVYVGGVLDPFIIGIYGVPKIAFGPLLVVWLGINLTPKIALAAMMTFFLVFFSTYQGIRNVNPAVINAARLMGASPLQLRWYVIFPAARSSILLGLKLGVPEALVGAIVGEFISSSRGIGYQIQYATAQLDTAGVFAGLVVLTVLSLLLNAVVNKASGDKEVIFR